MPMPKMATAKNRLLPMLTAPIAVGPTRPTIIVSTSPIAIHPISAVATGQASWNIGRSSARRSAKRARMAATIGESNTTAPDRSAPWSSHAPD